MNSNGFRPLAAEFLGVALFVFLGAGSIVANGMTTGALGPVGIALVHGLAMALIVSATISISGGHMNPAVTFGLWIAKQVNGRTAGGYVVAQLLGATLGAAMLLLCFPGASVRAMSYGTPLLSATTTFWHGVGLEAVTTFFLVSAVFGTIISKDAPKMGGFGVGIAILVGVLVAGPSTGGAMNPARAFGPAIVSWTLSGHMVYWIGPLLGGLVAALIWSRIISRKAA